MPIPEQEEAVRKLRLMWTPEMIDRFESDVRGLLEMNDKLTPEEREEIVTVLKRRAMELTNLWRSEREAN